MLAARVEPKNGRQKSKKTRNFKPMDLGQFQPAVDSFPRRRGYARRRRGVCAKLNKLGRPDGRKM